MSNNPEANGQQQQKLSIDEQVSLLLAHFNRANNSVAKEAEAALVKVVSQLLESQKQYDILKQEFATYKGNNPEPVITTRPDAATPPQP